LSTPIILGMGKATNFRFCTHIHRIDRNKKAHYISAKVAMGVYSRLSKISRPHRAVIFAVAQLSCSFCVFGQFSVWFRTVD